MNKLYAIPQCTVGFLRRAGVNTGLIVTLALLVLIGGGLYLFRYMSHREQVSAESLEELTMYCLECKGETRMSLEAARKLQREENRYLCPSCNKYGGTFEKPGTVSVMSGQGG